MMLIPATCYLLPALSVTCRLCTQQHGVQPPALLIEAREQGSIEHAATRQLDLHRVDEAAVHQDFVVQMGAGREPGRAHIPDHLTLSNAFAGLHPAGGGRRVAGWGLPSVRVPDADGLPVFAPQAHLVDRA